MNPTYTQLLVFVILFCTPLISFSQSQKSETPKFIIVDSATQTPIQGVTVLVFNKTQNKIVGNAITNADGLCFLSDNILIDTNNVLSFSVIGYKESQIHASFLRNQSFPVKVKLVNNSKILDEVKVTSRPPEVNIKGNTMEFDVNAVPNVRHMTIIDVLDYLPFIRAEEDNIKILNERLVILINGKPHPFYNTLKNLNALPPAAIEQIIVELVPSSNYGSKVMDIILKKNYFLGWNGNFSTGGSRLSSNSSGGISYWQNKFGVDVNGRLDFVTSIVNSDSRLKTFTNKSLLIQEERRKSHNVNGSFFASVFYNLDSLNTVDFQYVYAPVKTNSARNNSIRLETPLENENQLSFQDRDNNAYSSNYNLNYTKNFKKQGRQLYLLSQYVVSKGTDSYYLIHQTPDSILKQEMYANNTSQKASTLELGYRGRIRDKLRYRSGGKIIDRLNTSEIEQSDLKVPTNSVFGLFKYKQLVASLYAEGDLTIKKFTTHLGIRFDHEDFSYKQPVIIKRNFNGLFPTLSASYNANKYNVIVASYSRSVFRPNLASLVPIGVAENAYVKDSGSAQLKPQYTDNYSLQIYGNYKFARLGLDATYTSTKGFFDDYYLPTANSGITRFDINSQYLHGYTLGLSAEIPISKKINFSHYSSAGFTDQKGFNISQKLFTGYISERLNYRIDQKQRISISAVGYTPNVTLQGKSQSVAYVKTGISYSYFTTMFKKYPLGLTTALSNPWYINGTPGFEKQKDVSFTYYKRSQSANPVIGLQIVITFKGKQFMNKESKRTESINNNDLRP